MPRKIENLLKTGLPSKVFLLCYLNPESGYTLAQKIYPDKRYLPTAKIYDAIKRLKNKKYLELTKPFQPFQIRTSSLVKEIADAISGTDETYYTPESERLVEGEAKMVARVLKSPEFKKFIESSVISKYVSREPLQILRSASQEVNTFELISETLGFLCTMVYFHRNFIKQSALLEEEIPKGYYEPPGWKEEAIEYNDAIRLVQDLTNENLEKIARLWPMSQPLIFSYLYSAWKNQNEKENKKK